MNFGKSRQWSVIGRHLNSRVSSRNIFDLASRSTPVFSKRGHLAWVSLGVFLLGGGIIYNQIPSENQTSFMTRVHCNALDEDRRIKLKEEVTDSSSMRLRMEQYVKNLQKKIVAELEALDGKSFKVDTWKRKEGGDGVSCVLQEGNVFEKAGVLVSVVYGQLPQAAVEQMKSRHKEINPAHGPFPFFAAGISIVLHPHNPMAPTIHLNYRYFEITNEDGTPKVWWFGGGSDLTPSYLFEEDAIHFHKTLKNACDKHDLDYYPRFKKWCDEYFFIKHRQEARGVGGIFFDDLDDKSPDELFRFAKECGDAFLSSYVPILIRRKDMPYNNYEKRWQQLRRGRYVEFNLIWDRGTKFGLQTPGARIESILASLPLTAAWMYDFKPEDNSREAKLLEILKTPKSWIS
ncbi:hypothetical protein G9A89_017823 [Geosiphon pyriformis]|nr:hypothetical protein G9A89_017823 [Geosiphon pyriformis]